MDDKALAKVETSPLMVIEGLTLEQAQKQFHNLQQFVKAQMREGQDYGIIPGCKKPSLWKSGAERLLFFHGLGVRLDTTPETIVDWKTPFFNYAYRATIYNPRTNNVIATADGSCNSYENKYRYVWLAEYKLPRGTKKEDLQSKEVKGDKGTFTLYRMDNPELFSLVNTIQKMASKRAMVAATLMACRASDIFTQDEAPEPEDREHHEQKEAPPEQAHRPAGGEITEPQRRLVFARCKGAKVPDDALQSFLTEALPYTVTDGKAHTNKIKGPDLEQVLKWIAGYAENNA